MNLPCPWLPEVCGSLGPEITRRHGHHKGAAFFTDALRYAQWQWMNGKPAQAILQLNKAWMAEMPDGRHAVPYRAVVWIMKEAAGGSYGYLGNPVRHFQHLATRMSGPRAEVRVWRAWVCFHLAEMILPPWVGFRDGRQLVREGCYVPSLSRARERLRVLGWPGEAKEARRAADE